jgi:probable HAF family extracellular repeat protein
LFKPFFGYSVLAQEDFMIRLTSALWCALVLILFLAGPLAAAPRYYYQDLGVLPGGDQSYAYGLNNVGQVVGEANLHPSGGATHAFLKIPGQPMQDLGVMETGGGSKANGINDAGQVVGEGDANSRLRAFLKDPGQPMQDLGDLGGGVSRALGINNAGIVVGRSDYEDGLVTGVRAFLKNPGQDMQSLGTLGGWWSDAVAINDSGQVAGSSLLPKDSFGNAYARAFLKNPGQDMQDLDTLAGDKHNSNAFGLNNAGQVVGWSDDGINPNRAFLKTPGQPMQDLGALGGGSSWAYGINDAGQVVGWAEDLTSHLKAFLWEKGVMYNLNKLTVNLPGNGEWPGVFLGSATAINDRGWIVGTTGNWPPHAYLLIPVPTIAPVDMLLLSD